ncbi:MAG: VWA domain-containing protein [Xanthomonadales bacterium]|nr:VWA domain-containing protein [Xanthomonadales bacterium]
MIEIGPLVLLRPAWLLGWLLLPWLLKHGPGEAAGRGGWNTVIPARLQPLLLSGAASAGRGGWRWLLPSLFALALLAAAGPAWDRQPLPLARSSQAQVVVFDLSPSMAAADVRPDRLTRARFKLIDWLGEQRDGQVGLVVFGGQAFAVAPLTADARTLRHLAEVLDPDLMPVPGARADLGLEKARTLLQGAGVVGGEILLITDGINRRAERLLPALRADGIRVSVLAVGTAAGAPVPREGGGFLTDRNGAIVLPRLDEARLSRFASDGGGRYAAISVDGSDLQQLAGMVEGEADYDSEGPEQDSEYWRDRGPWLLLACLPLAALLFRRGWLLALPLALLLPTAAPVQAQDTARPAGTATDVPALGWQWADLWQRRDQQVANALAQQDPAKAESLATDPNWAGAAAAAAGDPARAARHFAAGSDATARYNEGTALAQAGQYEAAMAALRAALEVDPEHADANANLQAIEDWLRQQQQQDQNQQGQGSDENSDSQQDSGEQDSQQQDSGGQDGQDSQDGQQQDGQQEGDGEQNADGQSSEGSQDGQDPQESSDDDGAQPPGEDEEAADAQDGESSSESEGDEDANPGSDAADPAAGEEENGETADAAQAAGEEAEGQPEDQQAAAQAQAAQEAADEAQQQAPVLSGELGPEEAERQRQQALEQWLRRVPDDPGGLLRRKFQLESRRQSDPEPQSDEDSQW